MAANGMGIDRARKLALEWHRKPNVQTGTTTNTAGVQVDKQGHAYIEHLDQTEQGLRTLGADAELRACAYLHDIVEDTKMTLVKLAELGASERQLIAVAAVTKKSNEPQTEFLARIIEAGVDAMMLKLADLLSNMRRDRRDGLPVETQNRLRKKYSPSIATLMNKLGYLDTLAEYQAIPASSYSSYDYDSGDLYTFKKRSAVWFGENDEIQLGKAPNQRVLKVSSKKQKGQEITIRFTTGDYVVVPQTYQLMGRMTRFVAATGQSGSVVSVTPIGQGTLAIPTVPGPNTTSATSEVPKTDKTKNPSEALKAIKALAEKRAADTKAAVPPATFIPPSGSLDNKNSWTPQDALAVHSDD